MGRLPDPIALGLGAEPVVERPAVKGAAAIPFPMGADDEERTVHRLAGTPGGEVDVEELLVACELEPAEDRRALGRGGEVDAQKRIDAACPTADEEEP